MRHVAYYVITLLVIFLIATGCAPRILSLQVSTATEGQPVDVNAEIRPYLTNVGQPSMGVGPYLDSNGPFQPVGTMAHTSGIQYQGQLNNLTYGGYRLEMEVPYTLPLLQDSIRTYKDFIIGAPASCFAFDSGNNTQGWTVDGIYDGDTQVKVTQCSDTLFQNILWDDLTNWPGGPYNDGKGSMLLFVTPTCFPTQSSQLQNSWRFDLVSPSLEGNSDWQNIGGYTFRVKTNAPGTFNTGMIVQALLKLRKVDGTITWYRQVDTNNQPVWHVLDSTDWKVIEWPIPIPANWVVLDVHIRVFGVPQAVYPEGVIHLDGICPLPPN